MTAQRKPPAIKTASVVLIAGTEDVLARRELSRLIEANVTEKARGFDFSEFRSTEVDAGTLWNALITLPLLAEKRVVILHLQAEPKDELAKMLNRYVANPSPTTMLIMVQIFEDRGSPVKLEGFVSTIMCSGIKDPAKRAEWAQQYVKQAGKELPLDAAEYIVSASTSRLSEIAAKLEHAIMYSGENQVVTCKDLMTVAGVTAEYMPWQLEDAILERHAGKIFERARAMEAGGEELLRLLAYQRGSLLKLWKVGAVAKRLGIRKLDNSSRDLLIRESQSILGNKAFKSPGLLKTFSGLGEERIRSGVVDLLELEVNIKRGRAGWREYYDWIWRLIRPDSPAELQTLGRS